MLSWGLSWADSWGHSWTHSWAHSWVKFRFRLFCASSKNANFIDIVVSASLTELTAFVSPPLSEEAQTGASLLRCLPLVLKSSSQGPESLQLREHWSREHDGIHLTAHISRDKGSFYMPALVGLDPAVLKTLRGSELLRRSVFTTPPRFTTPQTLL